METHKRSIAKTITFRIVATITTMVLVWVFTRDWRVMGIVGVLDAVSKLIIFYAHERAWDRIAWGRKSA